MVMSETTFKNLDHNSPSLRIGMTEHKETIEFKSSGKFSVYNYEGVALLRNVTSHGKWRIKLEQNYDAKYYYNILMGKFHDIESAQELNYRLIEKGLGARIKTLGELYHKNNIIIDNSQYWVILDNFLSEQEAKLFAKNTLHNSRYKIFKEKIKESGAVLEIFDTDFEKLGQAENVLRIIPESPDEISYISNLTIDEEIHSKTYAFQGILEFRCSDAGKFMIINEIPLEKYIEAVIGSEAKSECSIEALKALAIVIRSKTIAGLKIKHYDEPFDLCAVSHCQIFSGISQKSENIIKAIKETQGQVLINNNRVFDSNYSLICGGYTENPATLDSEIMNNINTSVLDSNNKLHKTKFSKLSDDKKIREWIDSEPDVFCSDTGLNYFQKFFRWEQTFTRPELEEIISEKEAKHIGTLYDIIPTKRNVSGRVTEIEIIASNRNLLLQGEMNIRKIVTYDVLNSSCFYINKEIDEDGIPLCFTFHGAGMGHGVGLCLAGAIAMANKGYDYRKILNHYFNGTKIKQIY